MGSQETSSEFNLPLPLAEEGRRGRAEPPSNPEIGTIRSDPALIAEGWVRRHFVDPDRARESVELYTSMGYEVKVCKPAPEDFGPGCAECASVICRTHVLIYTRKKN